MCTGVHGRINVKVLAVWEMLRPVGGDVTPEHV